MEGLVACLVSHLSKTNVEVITSLVGFTTFASGTCTKQSSHLAQWPIKSYIHSGQLILITFSSNTPHWSILVENTEF